MEPDQSAARGGGQDASQPTVKLAITGANSQVGRNLLAHVADRNDVAATAGVRSQRAAETLPAAANIDPATVTYDNVAELAEILDGADSVVHLAGVLFESRTSSYTRANVTSTLAVIDAVQRARVRHLVFVSALGADAASANPYLRSKGEAERAILDSGLAATIVRTPILLGPDSAAGVSLLRAARRRAVALLGGGRHTVRPLDSDDLCKAILGACRRPPDGAKVYDFVGPEAVRYRDLLMRTVNLIGAQPRILNVPVGCARAAAAVSHGLRRSGMSPAVIDVITASEVVSHNADSELGVELTPLSETLNKLVVGAEGGAD